MSLLMDALKKAEETQRKTREGAASPDEPGGARLPDLPLRLETLDEELMAGVSGRPGNARQSPAGHGHGTETPSAAAAQAAARNLFEAKRPATQDRRLLALGAIVLLFAAAGGYFLWSSAPTLPPPPAPAIPAQAAAPAQPLAPVALPPAAVPAVSPLPTPEAARPEPPPTTPRPEAVPPRPQAASPDAAPTMRITASKAGTDPNLARGHALIEGGRLAEARHEYEQALRRDPRNIDALLGLAAIHLGEGRVAEAEAMYQRAAEADPKEALAQAALLVLREHPDPVQAESRLKTLLAAQPQQPFLHFALGNLYARQRRWHDAQQAYFNAHAGDPGNADYLFNLAVSLDQLRQARLAVEYYTRALAASERGHASFDRAATAARLREIQQP